MEKIAIYGKGGIGKSTVSSLLSSTFAKKGKKVLHIGCDPKQDSTISLAGRFITNTVIDACMKGDSIRKEDIVVKGRLGIDCVECGGPKAGVGCAGRGITRMFEVFEDLELLKGHDVALFDVLGDVVCGGFAAPLREGYANKVCIVVSEEMMSLYAANRIIEAINMYEYNGVRLQGLILNMRSNSSDISHVEKFAQLTGTKIICRVPRSEEILELEKENRNLIEERPQSEIARLFDALAERVLSDEKRLSPISISNEEFHSALR